MLADVLDDDRVTQVRLVIAIFQHRFLVRNARKFASRSNRATIGKFFEHASKNRLQRLEHIFLGDKAHFEIELVKFARRAVGAGVLVAEAGGDLEIAVETGNHQHLLEHLRRLRQRVEFARMDAARHEIIACAFR